MVWGHEVGKRSLLSRVGAMLLAVMLCAGLVPAAASSVAFADEIETEVVRIGYYEQEVFEEGASEGECKAGYAYEYYRKISETRAGSTSTSTATSASCTRCSSTGISTSSQA